MLIRTRYFVGRAILCAACCCFLNAEIHARELEAGTGYDLFGRSSQVAWCIVPFDGHKRGPEERAEMLEKLGFKSFAYDYRAEHIPTFDTEMDALQRRTVHKFAFASLKRQGTWDLR